MKTRPAAGAPIMAGLVLTLAGTTVVFIAWAVIFIARGLGSG